MKSITFKYFVTDIDGTLTDGKVYIGDDGETMKAFSIKDGYALSFLLRDAGVDTIVITGRTSKIVENRFRELGISNISQGVIEKLPKLREIVGEENFGECVYFGDDVLDLPCMLPIKKAGGIVGCPADAVSEVRAVADYICASKAADGAAREFVEWLLSNKPNQNEIEARVAKGLETVEELVAEGTEDGVYPICDWLTVELKHVTTESASGIDIESHRRHVDIQRVIEGEEAIDVAPTASLLPKSSYSEENDVALWRPKPFMTRIMLRPGSSVVLYPGDAHRPCVSPNGKRSEARVAVAKVRVG